MARLWPFRKDDPGPRPITAAAARIPLGDRRVKRPKPQEWQRRAWDFYDDIGEVKHAYLYKGDALAQVRLYVGVRVAADEAPTPVHDALELGIPGLDQTVADLAVGLLARVRSPIGGQSAILRELTQNIGIAGECYLLGRVDELGVETWDVLSVDELRAKGGGRWEVVTGPNTGIPLDPDTTYLFRVWRAHPRRSSLPDSAMRAVLDRCEELMLLQQGNMAIAQSRIANTGVLYVDNQLNPIGPVQPNGPDDAPADPFFESLVESMLAAISTPGDAAAVVPPIVRGDGPLNDRIAWVVQARDLGDAELARQDALVRRIAQGLPVPIERVLGLGDTSTYANALLVTQDEFTSYLEPDAELIADAFTSGWLQPGLVEALTEAGRDTQIAEQLCVWYDASDLIYEPTAEEDSRWLYEHLLISDDAARARLGASPDEAPDDAELARRIAAGQPRAAAVAATLPAPRQAALDVTSVELPALTAAGDSTTQARLDRLAERQATIDRALAARLLAACSAAVDDALRIAGSRLRSAAQGDSQLRARLRGVAAADVGTTLGRAAAARLDVTDDTLLAGAFVTLGDRYDEWVRRAQQASVRAVQQAGGRIDDRQLDDVTRQQNDDRAAGWAFLLGALVAATAARVFDPTLTAPTFGEFDASLNVAPGLVRQTLTIAGGQTTGTTVGPQGGAALVGVDGVQPAGAVATGPTVGDLLRSTLRARMVGWVWEHAALGEPARPFDPHLELDGVEFDSWTAPQLASDGGWPGVDFYYPGDHDYCTCLFSPRLSTDA